MSVLELDRVAEDEVIFLADVVLIDDHHTRAESDLVGRDLGDVDL